MWRQASKRQPSLASLRVHIRIVLCCFTACIFCLVCRQHVFKHGSMHSCSPHVQHVKSLPMRASGLCMQECTKISHAHANRMHNANADA